MAFPNHQKALADSKSYQRHFSDSVESMVAGVVAVPASIVHTYCAEQAALHMVVGEVDWEPPVWPGAELSSLRNHCVHASVKPEKE